MKCWDEIIRIQKKDINIIKALDDVVPKYGSFVNCSSTALDEAKTMIGHKTELVRMCKGKKHESFILLLHYPSVNSLWVNDKHQ